MKTLFVTGGTGFMGRHLLSSLSKGPFKKIYCLSRDPESTMANLSDSKNIQFVRGDIFASELYSKYLPSSDIVIHLAAITGKAEPAEYFRVNARGTEFLIQECERHGVKNFLFVSTIATKFTDISKYYYAQSKREAEVALGKSSLNYTIVRPTIVLDYESPIWQSLLKLVKRPFSVVFGDGKTKIQPIFVEDLVKCILTIIDENAFLNEEFDLGGPEVITFESLLRKIHLKSHGKDAPVIHIPLQLLIKLLTILERKLYSLLPVNVGQLSSFRYDSTIEHNRLLTLHQSNMTTVDQMLDILVNREKKKLIYNELVNECIIFCRYLVNQPHNDYVLEKYLEAHGAGQVYQNSEPSPFDKLLIHTAKINPTFTKLVDAYTRFFHKQSIFRKKLVLLLAILESCSPYYLSFETVDSPRRSLIFLRLFQQSLAFVFTSIISVLLLGPLDIMTRMVSRLRQTN